MLTLITRLYFLTLFIFFLYGDFRSVHDTVTGDQEDPYLGVGGDGVSREGVRGDGGHQVPHSTLVLSGHQEHWGEGGDHRGGGPGEGAGGEVQGGEGD